MRLAQDQRRIHELVREAMDLDDGERGRLLDRVRAEDPALHRDALALLQAMEQADQDGFLDNDAPARIAARIVGSDSIRADSHTGAVPPQPKRIGRYEVLREIGRGGMAVVYLGRRDDGIYDQQVAIKILRAGLFGDELGPRFRQERQILATLEHPHIARLLDGGIAEDGRPYLVLEYVDGHPIGLFADERGLSLERRIELVATVCDAVAYAHRRLIVHRDLKPSNILVDARGVPRLIDFGIAKLLAVDEAAEATRTQTGLRPLTPSYASPEQILGRPVGTTSDVYQLGVLLYELLTGARAHEGLTAGQLERKICEDDPPRPSEAAVGPGRRRELKGDLDAVVLKALAKDPDGRYESAAALALDLRRCLTGQPIQAQRPTWSYLTRKWVRRHRVVVAAALVALGALTAGLVGTTWQAQRAARERDRAQAEARRANQLKDYMLDVFRQTDPNRRGRDATVAELLERGLSRVERLTEQPREQADLFDMIGNMLSQHNSRDRAIDALERGLELRRADVDGSPEALAETMHLLAGQYHAAGRREEAIALIGEAIERLDGRQLEDPAAFAVYQQLLARFLTDEGRYDEAERWLVPAIRILREEKGDGSIYTGRAVSLLADLRGEQGKTDEAIDLLQQVVAIERNKGERPEVAGLLHRLGTAYHRAERLDEAERAYLEVIEIRTELFGPDHVVLAGTLNNLGQLYMQRGELEPAERLLFRTLSVKKSGYGPTHRALISSLNNLALVHISRERTDLAEPLLSESERLTQRHYPTDHPRSADTAVAMAHLRRAQQRNDEARTLVERALAVYREKFPEGHSKIRECMDLRAELGGGDEEAAGK